MPQPVRKAVIAAAGMGTRFLPQTKAMPKEMLPIMDKPVIQMVVEGLVDGGVEDIIIVTGPTKRAIEDHFDRSVEFEHELIAKGKDAVASQLRDIAEMANFIYVRQKGEPRGNARPILNAEHLIGDEPFFFFFADDFFTGELSTAQQLLSVHEKTGSAVAALRSVGDEEVSMYGIADVIEDKGEFVQIRRVVEKPSLENAPSRLSVAAGYLLTPDIFPLLHSLQPGQGGEIQIADAIEVLASDKDVFGVEIQGEYHDTGNPLAYLKTQISVALQDERYGDELRGYLKSLL